MLEDPDGNWTLEDVRSAEVASRFQHRSSALGYVTSVYWVRLALRNATSNDGIWWFDTSDRYLREIDFFTPRADGVYLRQSASSMNPFAQRPIRAPNFVFPAMLPVEQTVYVYLRIRSTGYLQASIRPILWQPEAFQSRQQRDRLSWSFYLGMAAALGTFNLLLFFSIRDRIFLIYVIAMVFTVVANDCLTAGQGSIGLMYGDLWPNSPTFNLMANWSGAYLSVVANVYFSAAYVDLRKIAPKSYRAGQWIVHFFGLVVAIAFLRILPQPMISGPVAKGLQFLSMISVIVLLVGLGSILARLMISGNIRSRWILIAWSPLLALTIITTVLRILYIYIDWVIPPIMLGSGVEMIMMSLALGARFNQERREKARAQARLVESLQQSERELEGMVEHRTKELKAEQASLKVEQKRTKELLYNILPVELADELSTTGVARSARYESATILFTDFSGFTQVASAMPADRMVTELNEIFGTFDDICDELGVEKIKSIGDAYMAAAGLPKPCADHAQRCVRAGLRMLDYIEHRNRLAPFKWSLRVGVHSGPVVTGVVGKRKYAFDVWGDTVNIASRMESAGEAGRVNVSAYTYDLIQAEFACDYRGKVDVKGKGQVDMYFVKGLLPE